METYTIAADRSTLTVSIRRILSGRGAFQRITGTVNADENAIPRSLEVSIDARSLRTGISLRDEHLKTATFLDAGRYPLITYTSGLIEQIGPGRYTITGVLRLHGHEHPVTLQARMEPAGESDGARRVRFSGTLSRSAFAIPHSPRLRAVVWAMFGDEVAVTGSVYLIPTREGVAAQAPSPRGSLSQG